MASRRRCRNIQAHVGQQDVSTVATDTQQELDGREQGVEVSKAHRVGGWQACFAWSDVLMCSHEVHLLLASMGIGDWSPCLKVWAGMESITKYATKVPSGSCKMSDVLKDAVAYSGMPLRGVERPRRFRVHGPRSCLAFENSTGDSNWGPHWGLSGIRKLGLAFRGL